MSKPANIKPRGRGEYRTRTRDGDPHIREQLMLLRRAIANGWPMTEEKLRDGLEVAHHIAKHGETERDRIAAAKVLAAMHGQNIALMQELDKQDRLNSGGDTERQTVFHVTVPGVPDDGT